MSLDRANRRVADGLRTFRAWTKTYENICAHKALVAKYLTRYALSCTTRDEARAVLRRAICHDLSKFRHDEAGAFVKLRLLPTREPIGTPEYDRMLAAFKRQAEMHYARNRHHPEHHDQGYAGMSQLDKLEMIADWAAAAHRRPGGDPLASIRERAQQYGFDEHESAWLRATARRMGALAE